MSTLKQTFLRARARVAFPALAVAMGISTLVAGLSHATYVVEASGHTLVESAISDSAPSVIPPTLTDSAVTTAVALPTGLNTSIQSTRIDAWIHRFTTSLSGDFSLSMTRMDKYASMITKKLDARDMPRELIYLAMIESNFNPTARSKVGAVGMWQFMSGTARALGLRVKGKTDERKNPSEATDAALTYLSDLHDRFGSWYLAAAAYNSGAGTVSKALRKVTGKTTGTDEDFFRILSALPKETQEYVPKLIAAAKVGSAPQQYGLAD